MPPPPWLLFCFKIGSHYYYQLAWNSVHTSPQRIAHLCFLSAEIKGRHYHALLFISCLRQSCVLQVDLKFTVHSQVLEFRLVPPCHVRLGFVSVGRARGRGCQASVQLLLPGAAPPQSCSHFPEVS